MRMVHWITFSVIAISVLLSVSQPLNADLQFSINPGLDGFIFIQNKHFVSGGWSFDIVAQPGGPFSQGTLTINAASTDPINIINVSVSQGFLVLNINKGAGSIPHIGVIDKGSGSGELVVNNIDIDGVIGFPGSPHQGFVEGNVIGNLFADGGITADIIALQRASGTAANITKVIARGGHIDGDVVAQFGRITDVVAETGDIGSPSNQVLIRARDGIDRVIASNGFATIESANGAITSATGLEVLNELRMVKDFTGVVRAPRLPRLNIVRDLIGSINTEVHKAAWTWTIGRSLIGEINIFKPKRLFGQIIINSENDPAGAWAPTGKVNVGTDPSAPTLTLDMAQYTTTPDELGDPAVGTGPRSVGLAPFALHDLASSPPNHGALAPVPPPEVRSVHMRHYGPLQHDSMSGVPFTVERKQSILLDPNAWQSVPTNNFKSMVSGNEFIITEEMNQAFIAGNDYRFTPTSDLKSGGGVTGAPAVLGDPALNAAGLDERYIVSITSGGGGSGCTTCICNLALCEFAGSTIGPGPAPPTST